MLIFVFLFAACHHSFDEEEEMLRHGDGKISGIPHGGGSGAPPLGTLCTVTYSGNGSTSGTAPTDLSSPYAVGVPVTVLGTGTLIKIGHSFVGWNTAANGSGTSYPTAATFNITSNTILYAQWTAVATTYTVTFNSNGGSAVTPAAGIAFSAAVTQPANPTKAGYVFCGWYKESAINNRWNFTLDTVTSNVTLYAGWYVPIDMVSSTGGTFNMGSPTTEPGRYGGEPLRSVTLSAFSIGKYTVTQEQYESVVGTNPSWHSTTRGNLPDLGETDVKRPVEMVNWYEAIVFCNRLSIMTGLDPVYEINGSTNPDSWGAVPTVTLDNVIYSGVVMLPANGYRLPTEAEWEFACRAGTITAFNDGNDDYTNTAQVITVAWYSPNSNTKTHQVGLLGGNNWNLFDMHGNVGEWCWDWYDDYSYSFQTRTKSTATGNEDPAGPSFGTARVLRGGAFHSDGRRIRSAYRDSYGPKNRDISNGFRVVRS